MGSAKSAGIPGAGTTGAEMGLPFVLCGSDVLLTDVGLDPAAVGRKRVEGLTAKWEEKGKNQAGSKRRGALTDHPLGDHGGFEVVDLWLRQSS